MHSSPDIETESYMKNIDKWKPRTYCNFLHQICRFSYKPLFFLNLCQFFYQPSSLNFNINLQHVQRIKIAGNGYTYAQHVGQSNTIGVEYSSTSYLASRNSVKCLNKFYTSIKVWRFINVLHCLLNHGSYSLWGKTESPVNKKLI